jgi:tetratricopeptide (TPR) repeat protein
MKNIKYLLSTSFILLLTLTSCNKFLDELPDNRTEIDTEAKAANLLVNAYNNASYVTLLELSSDNTDDVDGDVNVWYTRFNEQVYKWEDVTETDNENPSYVWQGFYQAIATANQALESMESMDQNSATVKAARGEALLCRAYAHFMLTNIFCQHYTKQYAATDLGIPYITKPEKTLNPKYDRGTVATDYEMIEKDLLEGLPLISDASYKVPRYHFNSKAAYTFASRFYLFYQKFDKAAEYATKALGDNPQDYMRDYNAIASLPVDQETRALQYTSATEKANFLLLPTYSTLGGYYGGYFKGSRYNHCFMVGANESMLVSPWGPKTDPTLFDAYKMRLFFYTSSHCNKMLFPHNPNQFQETNAVSHVGYSMSVVVGFKAEEALLNRAEAYIIQGGDANFQLALKDINLWINNAIRDTVVVHTGGYENGVEILKYHYTDKVMTLQKIKDWITAYEYYTPMAPTPRKHLHPEFVNLVEGSDQENLLQCLMYIRRQEFLQEGLRWFDVKRYDIEIPRRLINTTTKGVDKVTDLLKSRDPRRAIQLPTETLSAGMTANPREVLKTISPLNTYPK